MIADQNFYDICFMFFYPTASAMAYGQRPRFVRAEHSATAEGENCAYGPTLKPGYVQRGVLEFASLSYNWQIGNLPLRQANVLYTHL
jgi:hypothetical protein